MRRTSALFLAALLLVLSGCTGHYTTVISTAPSERPAAEIAARPDDAASAPKLSPSSEQTAAPASTPSPAPASTAEPEPDPVRGPSAIPEPEPSPEPGDEITGTYILNANTKKFHEPSCASVKDIKPENCVEFTGTRSEVLARGYVPCKRCKP